MQTSSEYWVQVSDDGEHWCDCLGTYDDKQAALRHFLFRHKRGNKARVVLRTDTVIYWRDGGKDNA